VVEGPKRIWRCGKSFQTLQIRAAAQDEYLEIMLRDGRTELRCGPTSIVQDPMQHTDIKIRQMTKLRNQELIVVYRPENSEGVGTASAQRHVVYGPKMYMPDSSSEWTHEFAWTDVRDEDAKKKDKTAAFRFTVLENAPGKMYHKVERVRTKDNALLTVKVMIFFSYSNIESMLDNTLDPFADIINATSADIIEWCVSKPFDEFLTSAENLNSLDVYRQLAAVTNKIGVDVQKVVFRGYEANDALQHLHDKSIEERTKMELMRQAEEQKQSLAEFTLQKLNERSAAEHQMQMDKLDHELKMQEKQLNMNKVERDMELERLQSIKKLDPQADIVKYLIAKEAPRPQVIQCGSLFTGGELDIDKSIKAKPGIFG
jgi:hypothetical protein